METDIYIYIYIYIYYINIYIYIHIHINIHISTYTHIHIYRNTCIHIYNIYIYIYIYNSPYSLRTASAETGWENSLFLLVVSRFHLVYLYIRKKSYWRWNLRLKYLLLEHICSRVYKVLATLKLKPTPCFLCQTYS